MPIDKKVKLYMNDAGRIFPQRKWGTTAYLVDGDLELVAATYGAQHSELPSLDHQQEKYWTDLNDPVVKAMVRKLRAEYKGHSKGDAQRSIWGILTADKETLSPEAQVHFNPEEGPRTEWPPSTSFPTRYLGSSEPSGSWASARPP